MFDDAPRHIACPIAAMAEARPDLPALRLPGATVGYGALHRRVTAVAGALHQRGVREGGRVVLVGKEDAAYLVAFWATLRLGAVACPLSPRLPPAALRERVRLLDAVLVVADTDDELAAAPVAGIGEGEELVLGRPATALFTSGSTGTPKAALHRLGAHHASALGANANMPLGPGDAWLLSLPLYHVAGIGVLFRAFVAGAAVAVPQPGDPIEASAQGAGVTHLSLVATQLRRLLDAEGGEMPGTLKAVLLGGSQLPPSLIDEAVARGWPLFTTYGMTEMASQVTATPPGATAAQLKTAGRVLPYREVRRASDGELLVRGATLFDGYLEADGLRVPFAADGWFRTGDLGYWDDAGNLCVVGRKDNLMISGGENIQPEEIESALVRCEGVLRALVVPVPSATYGERPVAFVETGEGYAGEGAVRASLEATLPRFKVPDAFYPWPGDAPATGVKPSRAWFAAEARRRATRSEGTSG